MTDAFRDPDLPLAARLDDLLSRLTLDEKVAMLHQHQAAVPRLGLAAWHTGMEALHGVAWLGVATVFPQAVGLASTWSPELMRRVGSVVGDEARGVRDRRPSVGLNTWAPVVNPLRDPRWGRNEEGLSEDPLLTGVMSTAYAHGLRGDDPRCLKTAPTLKHFLAYNREDDRDVASVSLRPRVLWEYELPAFRAAVTAGAATGVMLSYNLVNGRPAHLCPLVDDVVRSWSAEDLMVVSDAFGPSNIVSRQGYYPTHAESHAAAVRAGLDSFTDQGPDPSLTLRSIAEALARGLLTEAEVDTAARRTLSIRFRLGELDPPGRDPYAGLTAGVVDRPAHRALAREAAGAAIVLLRNEGELLPLTAGGGGRVAVIGPLADLLFEDWYCGTMPYRVTPLAGVRERLGADGLVEGVEGVDRIELLVAATGEPAGLGAVDVFDWGRGVCTLRSAANGRWVSAAEDGALICESVEPRAWEVRETFRLLPEADGAVLLQHVATGRYVAAGPDGLAASAEAPAAATRLRPRVVSAGLERATEAARAADIAVVVVGNAPLINGRETEDRLDLDLPPQQDRLVRAVCAANARTILVVESGYPYAITWAADHVPAIVWTSHGGQETGRALADVLFGHQVPAGRLTQTWYRSAGDLPDIRDYDVIGTRSTYLYFERPPLYPFGHGLSYTTFRYGDLRLSAPVLAGDGEVTVSVAVTNAGQRAGDEVVQLYTRVRGSRVPRPLRQLAGFRREPFQPGETRMVRFSLRAADLAHWDVTRGRYAVEAGECEVMVGPSSARIEAAGLLRVEGETIPARRVTGVEVRAADFDECGAVELVDETLRRGDAVAPAGRGAWIGFLGVDLGPAATGFTARVSRSAVGPAAIRVVLDDPAAGAQVAAVQVPCTGGRHAWVTAAAAVSGASGIHDLYLVFDGEANLASFTFT